MPDFHKLLNEKLAELPEFIREKQEAKKEEKSEKSEPAMSPFKESKEEKKERKEEKQASLVGFTDAVSKYTEKTAEIIRESHTPAVEQLFRNMVSGCMNFKIAGAAHDAFSAPNTLVKEAYDLALLAAENLDLPLQ